MLRASTARTCPYSAGLMLRSRTATSLCTVDLLHPNAAAAARTVALWAAIVLPQLHGALFWIGFHIPPPCVPALQWYNIRTAGADYVCGLDFLSPGAYTVGGHKNRGAVRLRSASRGVPFT